MQIWVTPVEWNASHENVVAVQLFSVGSKECSIELKSSAPVSLSLFSLVSIDLEISHLFSSFTELLGILDLDNS